MKELICIKCGIKLNTDNCYPSKFKYKIFRCNNCDKEWRDINSDKVKIYRQKYNKSEKGKLSSKNHYENNKEKYQTYWKTDKGKHISKMNKLKRKGIRHSFTYKEWMDKVRETNGVCPQCNKDVGVYKLTLDHIIPISAVPIGTYYDIGDVQPLCRSCNCSKNDKVIIK